MTELQVKTIIRRFDGEHAFLSNFHPSPIMTPTGLAFPTAEHLYQALKTNDLAWFERIRLASTPGMAKHFGRAAPRVNGWDEMKVRVMRGVLRAKFTQNVDLLQKLLATGDAGLIEGNTWGDRFWGVCRGEGENHLGKLLMELREEMRVVIALHQLVDAVEAKQAEIEVVPAGWDTLENVR
jgi:ribA/ribD-fused uncharacterized protein